MHKMLKKIVALKKKRQAISFERSPSSPAFRRPPSWSLLQELNEVATVGPQALSARTSPRSWPSSPQARRFKSLPEATRLRRVRSEEDLRSAPLSFDDISLNLQRAVEERQHIASLKGKMDIPRLQEFLAQTETFVSTILSALPKHLVYHNLEHTKDVVAMVKELITEHNSLCDRHNRPESKISEYQANLLEIAAWFHDIGFTNAYFGHEEQSAIIAGCQLRALGCGEIEIQLVQGMIRATKLPQNPQTFLEKLLCDADLANFGRDDFMKLGPKVRTELVKQGITKFKDEKAWFEHSRDMLMKHKFHTEAARFLFDKVDFNIFRLEKKLAALPKKSSSTKVSESSTLLGGTAAIARPAPAVPRPISRVHSSDSIPFPKPLTAIHLSSGVSAVRSRAVSLSSTSNHGSPLITPRVVIEVGASV
jgi:uncharacterized protein